VTFIAAHLNVVVSVRRANADSDWIFASGGPRGLLASRASELFPTRSIPGEKSALHLAREWCS
jgi:hypothetical protein